MALDFLEALKVLDLGQEISGPFCAKLLADLGARVIKVEPPEGDPARRMGPFPGDLPHPEKSGLYLALNTNKLGITLDPASPTGREHLLQLVAGADVLIENYPPAYLPGIGLDYATFQDLNPRLVMTSITPFGLTGPRPGSGAGPWAHYQANNLILSNLSGHSREHPGPVDSLEEKPPLQLAAHQADFVAGLAPDPSRGLAGATATVLALNRRRRHGQDCHLDVSGMETLALLPQTTLAEYALGIAPQGRQKGVAQRPSLLALLPCQDGYVGIFPRQQDQWERFVELMGNPEWAAGPKFATRDWPPTRIGGWPTGTTWSPFWRPGRPASPKRRFTLKPRPAMCPLSLSTPPLTCSPRPNSGLGNFSSRWITLSPGSCAPLLPP
jgi:crotonobetainyl-CoA:carnitine CoA-transferase CaiB-like acyl-CoA transferase